MKIYIAASFTKREQACRLRDRLIECGFIITSGWLNGQYPLYGNGNNLDMEKFSQMDLEDVTRAYCVVQITDVSIEDKNNKQQTKGGRHTELGFALAQGKHVFLLGPREQVFHFHPAVHQVNELDELIPLLIGFQRLEGLA